MPMYRAYSVDSGLVALAATGLTPLLYLTPSASTDANVIAVKASIETGSSAPTAVSNGNLLFSLNVVTGTKAGGGAVTPSKLGTPLASNTTVSSASSAAITGLTESTELWAGAVPFTAGAFTNEAWENTGREVNLAASSLNCFYVNCPSGPGDGANWFVRVVAWLAE